MTLSSPRLGEGVNARVISFVSEPDLESIFEALGSVENDAQMILTYLKPMTIL